MAARFSAALDVANAEGLGAGARGFVADGAGTAARHVGARRLGPDGPIVKRVLEDASVSALQVALLSMAGLLALGGLISAAGIRNPKRQ